MKNTWREIKNFFGNNKNVTHEELQEILKEIGATREVSQFDMTLYLFKPVNRYRNLGERIDELDEKLNRIIKYLDIEEKHTSEKKYFAKKVRAQKSS